MSIDPVSQWLQGLARSDESDVKRLWDAYFQRLVRLASRKLGAARRRAADEEDVALSAFHSLCRGAAAGRFPHLDDRDDLWRLLLVITARKVSALQKREHRQKRGGGAVRGESALRKPHASESNAGIANVLGTEPTPQLAAEMNEECARLLDCLHDGSLRTIALRKLDGYTNQEIADQLGYTLRTVEKKLARIREKWSDSPEAEPR